MKRILYGIDFVHVINFVEVIRLGSFRKAANALNVRGSTISRRIRVLEDRLGVILLDRSHSGVTLTFSGYNFLNGALDTLDKFDAIVTGIRKRELISQNLELLENKKTASDFFNL